MRGKRLAVKAFVYLTLVAWLGGVVFLVGYRVRHPIPENPNAKHNEQQAERIVGVDFSNAAPYSRQGNDNQSYASKVFDPMTLLTFLLVVGVGITAYIYWRQLKKMEETVALVGEQGETMKGQLTVMQGTLSAIETQERHMREQTRIMGDSLIISSRAYVTIAALGDIATTTRLVISIENRGHVPAQGVQLRLDALGGAEESYVTKTPNVRRTFRVPFSSDYGRAELFRDSLPFTYSIVLDSFLSIQEIGLIRQSHGILGLRGRITYYDGFDVNNPQQTDFSYLWLDGVWHAIAPDFWDGRVPESGITEKQETREDANPN
jgi:hypothetical protein